MQLNPKRLGLICATIGAYDAFSLTYGISIIRWLKSNFAGFVWFYFLYCLFHSVYEFVLFASWCVLSCVDDFVYVSGQLVCFFHGDSVFSLHAGDGDWSFVHEHIHARHERHLLCWMVVEIDGWYSHENTSYDEFDSCFAVFFASHIRKDEEE